MIVAVMAVAVTATALVDSRRERVYGATASIVIDPQAPQVLGEQVKEIVQLGAGNYWSNKDYYETQLEILNSHAIAVRTVKQDDLYKKLVQPTDGMSTEQQIELAAGILRGGLHVGRNEEHRIVRITVLHQDPELAARLANAVVDSYIDFTVGRRTEGVESAARWLAEELDSVEDDLRVSETKLNDYKRENAMVSLEDKQALVAANIKDYTAALNKARTSRIELGAVLDRIRDIEDLDVLETPMFMLGESSAFETIKAQYILEKNTFLELEQEFGPKSTEYVKQKEKVDELYKALQREATLIARAVEERHRAALTTEEALAKEVARLEAEARELDDLRPQYSRLKRKEDSDAEKYNIVLSQLRTSDLTGRLTASNVRPLDPARPSAAPVYPRIQRDVLIAAFASLILGIGLAFLLDMLDRTVKTVEDIETSAKAPLLGIIPIVEGANSSDDFGTRDLHVHEQPSSRAAECCRSIRTNLLFASADESKTSLLITSPNPREGKTTTTIYLGTTMAQSGQRVLLIDSDLRRPRLHRSMGVSRARGLTNLILGEVEVEDVIKTTDIPNLYVLPCGPTPPNPAELLMTSRFQQAIESLQGQFDRILFDSPPVLAVTDAAVLSRYVSGVILVSAAGKTTKDAVERAARQFADVDVRLTGVVLNQLDTEERQYGYYYQYYAYGSEIDEERSKSASSA